MMLTMSSLKDYIANYEASTQFFLNLARGVQKDQLDTKHENGWSARQIIHHMADSEAQSYARLRRLVAEPEGSLIQGYDESAWATAEFLGYETGDVTNSIAVYASVRAGSLDVLKRLSDADLAKWGEHSERGKMTVKDWLDSYTNHPHDHGDQLVRALKGQE